MANTRDIQRRIRGVKNTGKITRAMEMISAVKMRKAAQAVLAIRPYAEHILHVLRQVALALSQEKEKHPFLTKRPIKKELYVVIASNRGLCGAFNAQIIRKVRQVLQEDSDRDASFVTVGKKAEGALRRMKQNIIASFPDVLTDLHPEALRPVAKLILEEYASERVDRVVVIYTDYVSVMSQVVKVRALLPVTLSDTEKQITSMEGNTNESVALEALYRIEPSPNRVL
jgi:F-type H+-transporting ATPase subunit gamma